MREIFEFRVPAASAPLLFGPRDGRLAGGARAVHVAAEDPRFARIGAIDRAMRARGEGAFFSSWSVRRTFTDEESRAAEAFHLAIRRVVEPAGAECGTTYDRASACSSCGIGARQTSPLRLDCRRAAGSAIASTMAGEIVVSKSVADRLAAERFTGFELRPVERPPAEWPGPFRFESVPSGRRLLERARSAGIAPHSFEFMVWAGDGAQGPLVEAARAEAAPGERGAPRPEPRFLQLVPAARPVEVIPPTRCGIDPFDPDAEGRYRCAEGHTLGLALLTTVTVARASHDGSDLVATRAAVGWKAGHLAAASPLLLVSPRLAAALRAMAGRAVRLEPAALG